MAERTLLHDLGACTFYRAGEFMGNFYKSECRAMKIFIGKYAQYNSAICVEYLEKGKKRWREFVQTFKPNLIVLPGHGHFEPPGMFNDIGGGVQQSKYSSFSDGWQTDFDKVLAEYLASGRVSPIADFRGFDTYANSSKNIVAAVDK